MKEPAQNKNVEIVFACKENKIFIGEIVLNNHSFVHILSGEMKVVMADSSYIFNAGDSLLFPRNQLANAVKYPKDGLPYKSVSLNLTKEFLENYYTQNHFELTQPHTHKIKVFEKHPLLESFFSSLIPYFDLKEKLPHKLVAIKLNEAITILRIIDKDIDFLLANFEDPGKINLADFMEQNYMFNLPMEKFGYLTGRSLTTFKRDFKKIFNITPQKWLTQKRLELAYYQILEKSRKPSDIYIEVGFENLSHFSFAFKKQFGITPSELYKSYTTVQN